MWYVAVTVLFGVGIESESKNCHELSLPVTALPQVLDAKNEDLVVEEAVVSGFKLTYAAKGA